MKTHKKKFISVILVYFMIVGVVLGCADVGYARRVRGEEDVVLEQMFTELGIPTWEKILLEVRQAEREEFPVSGRLKPRKMIFGIILGEQNSQVVEDARYVIKGSGVFLIKKKNGVDVFLSVGGISGKMFGFEHDIVSIGEQIYILVEDEEGKMSLFLLYKNTSLREPRLKERICDLKLYNGAYYIPFEKLSEVNEEVKRFFK